jgi:polyhydroxybutyrate depolymerase
MKTTYLIALVLVLCLLCAAAWLFYAPSPAALKEAAAQRTVTIDGLSRSFTVYSPPGLQADAPALLVLHGSLMDGPKMRAMLGAGLERLARERGIVVVYPTGFEGHFNDGRVTASYSARTLNLDDVGFARAIVNGLVAEHQVDRKRVYALGYSNGGHMAMRLAAQAPDLVAGIIAVNANVPTPDNMGWLLAPAALATQTRIVLMEGTKDPINPYAGGRVTIFGFGDRGTVLSSPDSALWFAQRAGLAATPASDSVQRIDGLEVRQQDWGVPTRVRLLTLHGAGHTVPQADYRFPRFLGATVQDDGLLRSAWELLDGP